MDLKRKLWRQIIILASILVGASLLFLFVVFPVLVRVTGTANSARNQIIEQKLPPQAPVLETNVRFVDDADFTVHGFAKSDTTVYIVLNDELMDNVVVGSNGRFQIHLNLMEGDNNVYAYAVDENGLESANSAEYLVILDTEKPILVFNPEPNRNIVGKNNRQLTLTGETEIGSKIYINGTLGRVDETGQFVLSYYLNDGDNELTVEVIDGAGNSEQVVLGINFKP